MKICIIGGSGFVGTHLIRKIRSKHDVLIVDKNVNTEFESITLQMDIRNSDFLGLDLKKFDLIIHLAAEHRDDVTPASLYYDVNVEGTRNILEVMNRNEIHNIIFTSTVAIYGLNKNNPNELSPADPFNDYGKSKWQAEQVLYSWQKKAPSERRVSIIRPSVIFGEENRGNVYNLLKQIVEGRFVMIGKGENKKSMAYVGNIVGFIESLIDYRGSGIGVYNYADTPDLTTHELVDIIKKTLHVKIPSIRIPYLMGIMGGYGFDIISKLSGKKLPISSVRVRKFCADTKIDSSKVQLSGFIPPFDIKEGLIRTIKYEFSD